LEIYLTKVVTMPVDYTAKNSKSIPENRQ